MSNEEKSIPLEDIDVSDLGLHDSMVRKGLFLGHLTLPQVEELVKDRGLLRAIQDRGYKDPVVSLEAESLEDNRIHIHLPQGEDLFFLRLRLGSFPVAGPNPVRLISVDWFQTQNIRRKEHLFPGQKYPGLGFGVLRVFKSLLHAFVERTGASGIITVPEYFHDAVLFHRFMHCRFLNPEKAADFENLQILPGARELSRAIHDGRVKEKKSGEIYSWRHGEMVFFKMDYLNRMVFDSKYERAYRRSLQSGKYVLDE